ncbi:hypothetical protein [Rhodococcus sp. Chr-9]|uniref:hypothetical protein n=1 Tax=Rhodococcus sp. Chr-9 TaxID=713612 RepID=UPI001F3ED899|nr:hypothetical protein [Rhodococcus sp. Chr-9]
MSRHDLPVPDYDELAPGTLAPRIRALDEAQWTITPPLRHGVAEQTPKRGRP